MSVSKLTSHFENMISSSQVNSPSPRRLSRVETVALETLNSQEQTALEEQLAQRRLRPSPNLDLERGFVFGNRLLVASKNESRLEDLAHFIIANRNRLKAEDYRAMAHSRRLVSSRESFGFSGNYRKGVCNGGATSLLKEAIRQKSVRLAAQKFDGGMPIEAYKYQSIYYHFNASKKSREAAALIIEMIDTGEEGEYKGKLIEKCGEAYWDLYIIFKKHLNEENFSNIDLDTLMQATCTTDDLKNTLEMVYGYYTDALGAFNQKKLSFILELANLTIQETIHQRVDAATILESIDHLSPGHYYLSIPVQKSNGEKVDAHAGILVIEEEGSYFFDPNLGIGESDKSTIARDFALYSGKKVSELGTLPRVKAALTGMVAEFSLYKIDTL